MVGHSRVWVFCIGGFKVNGWDFCFVDRWCILLHIVLAIVVLWARSIVVGPSILFRLFPGVRSSHASCVLFLFEFPRLVGSRICQWIWSSILDVPVLGLGGSVVVLSIVPLFLCSSVGHPQCVVPVIHPNLRRRHSRMLILGWVLVLGHLPWCLLHLVMIGRLLGCWFFLACVWFWSCSPGVSRAIVLFVQLVFMVISRMWGFYGQFWWWMVGSSRWGMVANVQGLSGQLEILFHIYRSIVLSG